jgi:oligoribonuclease (3'-5' exoribonuclease)
MATQKGKPRGWFEKLLAVDCETTGLFFNEDDPSYDDKTGKHHQAISWGLIVADSATLTPIEELYIEVQWDGKSEWNTKAQEIHGLSKTHLAEHGLPPDDAAAAIANLIIKHWGPNGNVRLLGHNVLSFDKKFLQRTMRNVGINLKFGSRHIDTNSVGFATFETYTSDELFEAIGYESRDDHNALDDARMALKAAQVVRKIFQAAIK